MSVNNFYTLISIIIEIKTKHFLPQYVFHETVQKTKILLKSMHETHPNVILTVGAGAIMPIGTGIMGVPEKDKT